MLIHAFRSEYPENKKSTCLTQMLFFMYVTRFELATFWKTGYSVALDFTGFFRGQFSVYTEVYTVMQSSFSCVLFQLRLSFR